MEVRVCLPPSLPTYLPLAYPQSVDATNKPNNPNNPKNNSSLNNSNTPTPTIPLIPPQYPQFLKCPYHYNLQGWAHAADDKRREKFGLLCNAMPVRVVVGVGGGEGVVRAVT